VHLTALYKKNDSQIHSCLFRAALVSLSLCCVFFANSCKPDKTAAPPEKDPGIHEKFERGPAVLTLDVDRKEISIADRLNLMISISVDEEYDV